MKILPILLPKVYEKEKHFFQDYDSEDEKYIYGQKNYYYQNMKRNNHSIQYPNKKWKRKYFY